MELRAAARLNRDAAPAAVCDDYLAALGLAPTDRARIAARVRERDRCALGA